MQLHVKSRLRICCAPYGCPPPLRAETPSLRIHDRPAVFCFFHMEQVSFS